jgi:dTDP-4-dehydrorhamnose 3,5-epimerase
MSGRFTLLPTSLDDLRILERHPLGDSRGYLERVFCAGELSTVMGNKTIAQLNHTLTKGRGTVRGMHFQRPPFAETKIVSCLVGEIYDVAIDLRLGSRTRFHWFGERLSAENHRSMVIPPGFAHGFQLLSESCQILYIHSAPYSRDAEGGVSPIDPRVNITWPLGITMMSERDRDHTPLNDNDGLML